MYTNIELLFTAIFIIAWPTVCKEFQEYGTFANYFHLRFIINKYIIINIYIYIYIYIYINI
jgi:hypothetical protein